MFDPVKSVKPDPRVDPDTVSPGQSDGQPDKLFDHVLPNPRAGRI